jgi:hypothetical protein
MRSGVLIFLGGVGMEELTKITEARNYNTRKQHFFGSQSSAYRYIVLVLLH